MINISLLLPARFLQNRQTGFGLCEHYWFNKSFPERVFVIKGVHWVDPMNIGSPSDLTMKNRVSSDKIFRESSIYKFPLATKIQGRKNLILFHFLEIKLRKE